jgi:hypothetical protein
MAGSFESGAGDIDEIFESNDEQEGESEGEAETEQEVADTPNGGRKNLDSDNNQKQASAANPPTDSRDRDQNQKNSIADADTDSERVTVELEIDADFDAARLAHEFVPDSYDKPHAWALGRNGVNDGRQEKKTFFLQEQILGLEEECRSEVNETLGGDVPLTDMRELALIIAYHQPERIAEAAQEWGSESV